ncbi:hypothetical protein APSETT445_006998 [Aspergillus pseudonomiae]
METRAILLDRMVQYVASVDNVDSLYNNGTSIPTLQEYWERRECTAGVYPVIATIPFAYGLDITKTDIEHPYMKKLWRHTSYLVHIYSGTRYFQETEIGADHVIRFEIDSSPRDTKETELKATR